MFNGGELLCPAVDVLIGGCGGHLEPGIGSWKELQNTNRYWTKFSILLEHIPWISANFFHPKNDLHLILDLRLLLETLSLCPAIIDLLARYRLSTNPPPLILARPKVDALRRLL